MGNWDQSSYDGDDQGPEVAIVVVIKLVILLLGIISLVVVIARACCNCCSEKNRGRIISPPAAVDDRRPLVAQAHNTTVAMPDYAPTAKYAQANPYPNAAYHSAPPAYPHART